MKIFRVFLLGCFLLLGKGIFAQCTITNGASCVCKDGSSDCDLLPDITISWYAIVNHMSGPNEYSQTGNGPDNGRLKLTGSTANIGHGPLTVRGSDYFVCGGDTVLGDPGICPDGSAPRQLIVQRIYHRNADSTMTYTDIWAGAMTYHPSHGHNHVDDWGVFSLRLEDPNEPDPRNWPIVGDGAKLGFCLMDYGTCSSYLGHCKDDNTTYLMGNDLLNGDFPNWGLGGGNYNCSVVEQGISSGYTDIYSENLDGMWINIPPGTCNGDYWIVAEVDPKNNFIEEDETNNYTAVPITLTLQDPPGNPNFQITSNGGTEFCAGTSVTLTAPAGTDYQWSNGDTTQSIVVTQSGTFDVNLTNHCGTATSQPITVSVLPAPSATTVTGDTLVCEGQSVQLSAGTTDVNWYDQNGFLVGTGSPFTTPSLNSTATYMAEPLLSTAGATVTNGIPDTVGGNGGYFSGSQYMLFDVMIPLRIKSVKVFANGAGPRTIQVLDQGGNLVTGGTYNLPDGESVINLNYDLAVGNNYQITVPTNANLYRSSAGISYPYEIVDTMSITGSTAGGGFYYYFYDWVLEVGLSSCAGPTTSHTIQVENCDGIDDVDLTQNLSISPNPNNGNFTMNLEIPGTASFLYDIVDVNGKVVLSKMEDSSTGLYQKELNLESVVPGVYFVRLNIMNQVITQRFIIAQ